MICISVAPTSRKLAKVDLLNASSQADMIELCLDHLVKEPDVGDMLTAVSKPVLVSCRRPAEGGQFTGTDEQRMALLRQAIIAEPAYVELDTETAKSIPRFGKTQRVVAFTSLNQPIGKIEPIIDAAQELNADVVKVVGLTPSLGAVWPLLAATTQEQKLPVVGMGLGNAGLTYSLLGKKYGAPWVYAALEKGMEAYPGQPTIDDLKSWYNLEDINSKTQFVGIAEFPAEFQSVVARRLNAAFAEVDSPMRCLPFPLGDLKKISKRLDVLRIKSVVVGGGYKHDLTTLATEIEPYAQQSGCIDTLFYRSSKWHGYNTLWRSLLTSLEQALPKSETGRKPLDGRNVLVVGANPLAETVALGIGRREALLSFTSPNEKQVLSICDKFSARHVPFAQIYDTLADVVIITDPEIKMGHHRSELNPSYLRPNMIVADVTDLNKETGFVREARERGAHAVATRDIFRGQLATQFKAITGQELPEDNWSSD